MVVRVEQNRCIGCGLCEETIPEVFTIGDYTAIARDVPISEYLGVRLREMASDCPAEAIIIDD